MTSLLWPTRSREISWHFECWLYADCATYSLDSAQHHAHHNTGKIRYLPSIVVFQVSLSEPWSLSSACTVMNPNHSLIPVKLRCRVWYNVLLELYHRLYHHVTSHIRWQVETVSWVPRDTSDSSEIDHIIGCSIQSDAEKLKIAQWCHFMTSNMRNSSKINTEAQTRLVI